MVNDQASQRQRYWARKCFPGDAGAEWGILLGLLAILSFYAVPFVQGQLEGTGGSAPSLSQSSLGAGLKGSGGKSGTGKMQDSMQVLFSASGGQGVNVTSIDGIKWDRVDDETASRAKVMSDMVKQLQANAQSDPTTIKLIQKLASGGQGMASLQQAIISACKPGVPCQGGDTQRLQKLRAEFERDLQKLVRHLSDNPQALTPEMQHLVASKATQILSISGSVSDSVDLKQLEVVYNQCKNSQDVRRCFEDHIR